MTAAPAGDNGELTRNPTATRISEVAAIAPGVQITAAGELDLSSVALLRARLDEASNDARRRVVLDLTEVTFIDSMSLAAVVALKRKLGNGGRLALVATNPYVLLILEAGGLESVLDVFETLDEAIAFVGA